MKRLKHAYDDPYKDVDFSDGDSLQKRFDLIINPKFGDKYWVGNGSGADILYDPTTNHLYGLVDKELKKPLEGNHNAIEQLMIHKHTPFTLGNLLNMWIWPNGKMRAWSESPLTTDDERIEILAKLKRLKELLSSLEYDTSKLTYYDSWTGDETLIDVLLEGDK